MTKAETTESESHLPKILRLTLKRPSWSILCSLHGLHLVSSDTAGKAGWSFARGTNTG